MAKIIKYIIIILIVIILSGCGIIPDPPEPNETIYRAFVVGVEDCDIDSMDLPVAGYNVERIKEILSNCKFTEDEIEFSSINTLRGSDPTKEAILSGIVSIFREADENDISYFYFMGHGGVRNGQPIFCPTDYTGSMKFNITLEELESIFDMIQGTKILFLESCHSGNFIEKDFNKKIIDTFRTKAFNKENYQVITSCKGKQFSYYCGYVSYFTMGLYQGCKNLSADYNRDKVIDLSELYEYIIDWVDDHTANNQDAQMYPDESAFSIIEY